MLDITIAMVTEKNMLQINRPMLDYLRLTKFSPTRIKEWETLFAHIDTPAEEARFLQYRGIRAGGLFFGDARQRSRRHWLLDISGSLSDALFRRARIDDCKCTRIDLQVTIDLPHGFDARRLYDELENAEWHGRKRNVALVQSGDGFDTIYIGSRTSERFFRIYVKEDGKGRKLLRFETEYKSDKAEAMWRSIDWMPGRVSSHLKHEIESLPRLKIRALYALAEACGTNSLSPPPETRENGGSTWRWLRGDVDKAVRRLMRDHDLGSQVRYLVLEWAEDATELTDGTTD